MGLFNFSDNGKGRTPAPAWARKVGKVVAAIFDLEDGTHAVARVGNKETFTDNSAGSGNSILMPDLWRVYNDRKSVYQDIERMISEDEIIPTAIDIVADRTISNSDARQSFKKKPKRTAFAVTSEDKEVEKILQALNRRLKIEGEIWQIVHEFYPHGNSFREVILDRQAKDSPTGMRIKGFKQTISYQIWPKTNDHGDKLPGWLVVTDQDVPSQGGKELEEWQIIPFIFGERKGFLAVAPLAAARRNWQRLSKMEDGMAVARLVRAYDKIVHRIPIKSEWTRDEIMATIKRYKDAITKRKLVASDGSLMNTENPLDVQTDFYLPDDGSGKGGVAMLSANNTQLGNLNDVLYHREKLVCRLKVPVSYLQLQAGQKTHVAAGASMSNADISFAYTIQHVQNVVIDGLSRLYDLELMLHGIAPEEGLYTIELAPVIPKDRVEDANIELTYAQAAVYFVEAFGALPAELIAEKFMSLTHDQQELMDKFLSTDATKIWAAKIKSIEAGADAIENGAKAALVKDRLPGDNKAGSGNNNKSRAKRTSEQIGKSGSSKQSIDLDDLVEVVYQVYDSVADDLRAEGQDVPYFNDADREEIKQNILSRMSEEGELVVS
jgi:hypothetical protein